MPHDAIVQRRWSEILPTLDELGLEARHSLLDDMGGDRVDIHLTGSPEDGEPLGTVRFIEGGWYRGKAVDDDGTVQKGPSHRTIMDAFEDVIDIIRKSSE